MKRTESINIGGALFYVDDDAFQILKDYIEKLERWFQDKEGGADVVHDIELRLSEIFTGLTKGGELIVTQGMVREAIASVGQPEEFDGEAASDNKQPNFEIKAPRRLYRDRLNSVVGGVCAGLAAYLNMDVSIVRILFVVLPFLSFGGIGLVYLVLWIALPEAVTPAQRLEMQGEPITVPNIEKKVSDGFKAVKNDVGDLRSRWFSQNNRRHTTLILVVLFLLVVYASRGFHFPPFLSFVSDGFHPAFNFFPFFFKGAFYGLLFIGGGLLFKGGARIALIVVGLLVLLFSLFKWMVFAFGGSMHDFFVYI